MKIITNQNTVNYYLEKYQIEQIFEKLPQCFYIKEYNKDEVIINPLNKATDFHFIVEGNVHIYSIHPDGSIYTLVIQDNLTLLGDMEYVDDDYPHYFVEAKTKVTALCLEMDKQYKNDTLFLQYLLKSLASKLKQSSYSQSEFNHLEDKLISYMKYHCENQTLTQIEKTAMNLHCSRRQLQRILHQLIEEGKIMKIKKGTYQLL